MLLCQIPNLVFYSVCIIASFKRFVLFYGGKGKGGVNSGVNEAEQSESEWRVCAFWSMYSLRGIIKRTERSLLVCFPAGVRTCVRSEPDLYCTLYEIWFHPLRSLFLRLAVAREGCLSLISQFFVQGDILLHRGKHFSLQALLCSNSSNSVTGFRAECH